MLENLQEKIEMNSIHETNIITTAFQDWGISDKRVIICLVNKSKEVVNTFYYGELYKYDDGWTLEFTTENGLESVVYDDDLEETKQQIKQEIKDVWNSNEWVNDDKIYLLVKEVL